MQLAVSELLALLGCGLLSDFVTLRQQCNQCGGRNVLRDGCGLLSDFVTLRQQCNGAYSYYN